MANSQLNINCSTVTAMDWKIKQLKCAIIQVTDR